MNKLKLCRTCNLWKKVEESRWIVTSETRRDRVPMGECRCYAPQCLSGSGTGWSSQLFAITYEDDWCGEWEEMEVDD